MKTADRDLLAALDRDGFLLVPGVVPREELGDLLADLAAVLSEHQQAAPVRSTGGNIYAARNLLALWPAAATLAERPPLPSILAEVLGPGYGLVRALYFDKPPDRTWALPWHKDLTVAVGDNRLPSAAFTKPTRKAGVPHAEAPLEVLERMLSVRFHLDAMTEENGPLRVLPGSHRTGKTLRCEGFDSRTILSEAGDALLMRPLLTHASNCSRPDTSHHRRVVHLEFAATEDLPDGYVWYDFRAGLDPAGEVAAGRRDRTGP
jgi:hypothetical protein